MGYSDFQLVLCTVNPDFITPSSAANTQTTIDLPESAAEQRKHGTFGAESDGQLTDSVESGRYASVLLTRLNITTSFFSPRIQARNPVSSLCKRQLIHIITIPTPTMLRQHRWARDVEHITQIFMRYTLSITLRGFSKVKQKCFQFYLCPEFATANR